MAKRHIYDHTRATDGIIENPNHPTHKDLNSLYLSGEFIVEYSNQVNKLFCSNSENLPICKK